MIRDSFLVVTLLSILAVNSFAQIVARIQVDFDGPVELLVTDSQGEMCGYNPITKIYYNGISYAGYGSGSNDNAREFAFSSALKDTLFSTIYNIQVFGIGSGLFTGDGGAAQTWSGKGGGFHVVGVIDSNQTVTYRFSYSTDSTITPTMAKVVTPEIILQDFKDCFKLNLLGDIEFYGEIRNQLNNFDRHIDHNDSVEARKELEKFWNRIQQVYSDTVDHENKDHNAESGEFEHGHKDFVTQEAYQILNEDVTMMLEELPAEHNGRHEGDGKRKR